MFEPKQLDDVTKKDAHSDIFRASLQQFRRQRWHETGQKHFQREAHDLQSQRRAEEASFAETRRHIERPVSSGKLPQKSDIGERQPAEHQQIVRGRRAEPIEHHDGLSNRRSEQHD